MKSLRMSQKSFLDNKQAQKLGKDASENQNILDKIRLGSLQIKK